METLVAYLADLDPVWVYVSVGCIAFIENVFPPFPSDVLVVAAGSFSAVKNVDPVLIVAIATGGSTLGFVTMYAIGGWFGRKILDAGRISFLPLEKVAQVEAWFRRYGYAVIVANRFLAGTRAVVSFFAGVSDLRLLPCVVLSFVSALIWNSLLVLAGHSLGENWREILVYMESYGELVTGLFIVALIGFLVYRAYTNRSEAPSDGPGASS